MEIFGTLKQIALYNEENYRTTKKKIGTTIVEIFAKNKIGIRKRVGYVNLSQIAAEVAKRYYDQ